MRMDASKLGCHDTYPPQKPGSTHLICMTTTGIGRLLGDFFFLHYTWFCHFVSVNDILLDALTIRFELECFMKWGHSIQYSIHLVTKLQWLHLHNCWTTQRWHAASDVKLHITNILQVIGLGTNKQTHLGGSEYLSLSPWRRIIMLWFKLSYGVAHSAAMQKLHSTQSSKVGTNKAATNNFIFECTPFLLFEADVLTDFWAEANTCYVGQLRVQLDRYSSAPSSQSYNFRHRCWLQ